MPSEKFTPFHARDIPNLSGYVALITGGNSGIGYETTFQLALHGARVYIAGRSPERLQKAIDQMKVSSAQPLDLHMLEMDLQNLRSVKDGAERFMKQESRLDLLINNAGVMAIPFQLTTDGYEIQWQTNHLAPFLLTKTLLPILESTAASSTSKDRVRIINVASDGAMMRPAPKNLDLAHPNLEYLTGATDTWKRYGHSKIASIVHARALHDRFRSKGISAYSLHPGVIPTNLLNTDTSLIGALVKFSVRWHIMPGTITLASGATATLFCATSPHAARNSGAYFAPGGKLDRRPEERWTGKREVVERLWGESERMVGEGGF